MLSFISIISSLSLKKHIAIVDKKSIRTQNYFEFKPWKQESTLNQAKNKFSIEGWSTLSETYDQNGDQQVRNEISTSLFPPLQATICLSWFIFHIHIQMFKKKFLKNLLTSLEYCILCWIQYYICFYLLWKIISFPSVVFKDTLSSVLFGSLQEALWLHLHFSTTSTTLKHLQLSMLTERLPVGLMSSVVAPEKPAPNTMGPKEVRRNLSKLYLSPHIQSLWVLLFSVSIRVCPLI